MIKQCLICAKPVEGDLEYHANCSKSFFGMFPPPALDFTMANLQDLAAQSVLARITVTGAQKKLSLGIEKRGKESRFTIVGLWGRFILKPPVDEYPSLPENEDTMMRLASLLDIAVVPHAMVRLSSGELAYISRRIDRGNGGGKIAMEDFCQIAGRLTEDKYRGSVERVGNLLRQFSIYPGLDSVDLFERVLFNYACGNSDMHLKNYSLVETPQGHRFSPAYDLVSTVLALPDDIEESALTINGKKTKLALSDFTALAKNLQIGEAVYRKTYAKFCGSNDNLCAMVRKSRLPQPMQDNLCGVITRRLDIFRQ